MAVEKTCAICGKLFMARNRTYKACSPECRAIYSRLTVERHRANLKRMLAPRTGPTQLDLDAKKARENNVSYGYYVAVIKPKEVADNDGLRKSGERNYIASSKGLS